MASSTDWLARCDWQRRTPEFGDLADRGGQTVFAWTPRVSKATWELWRGLRMPHPNVLAVAEPGWLRYAAIDWSHARVSIGTNAALAARVATWGAVVGRALEDLLQEVGSNQMGWFSQPVVRFDLEGAMRMGFEEGEVAPELYETWPRCDERGLVFVVGRVLRQLAAIPVGSDLARIVSKCTERDAARRYKSIEVLLGALRGAGGRPIMHAAKRKPRTNWQVIEHALGRLAVGDAARAAITLEVAGDSEQVVAIRRELAERIDERTAVIVASARLDPLPAWGGTPKLVSSPVAEPEPERSWGEIADEVGWWREQRDFARVDAMLQRCPDAPWAERAKAKLDLGLFGPALEIASEFHGHAFIAAALAGLKKHEEMLAAADAWIAASPDEGRAHQARGVALIRLKRLVEARDAFDRAALLAPKLTIALLLRRECDHMMRVISERVGDQPPMSLETEPRVDELLAKIEAMA